MGRQDPTFSARDVVRIWKNNLTPAERDAVYCFFVIIVDNARGGITGRLFPNLLGSILGIFPVIGDAFEILLETIEIIRGLQEIFDCREKAAALFQTSGLVFDDIVALA